MTYTANTLLDALLTAAPARTCDAPRDRRGLYGLIDHNGSLRYIGSTSSLAETLYKRIHQRHRTGSETHSHYFSRMYNSGRMWRDRLSQMGEADGDTAKRLRNAFIAEHCRAVWVCLPDDVDIAGLESAVIAIAPKEATAWNRRAMASYPEPVALVNETIKRLGLSKDEIDSVERQRARHAIHEGVVLDLPSDSQSDGSYAEEFPVGPFRFIALDVETANNNRDSICQIGIACVRPNGEIATWSSYIDPRTDDWTCSWVHQITAATVRGAPTFARVFHFLAGILEGQIVFQHSGFDRSAIEAACKAHSVAAPDWDWRDSVSVARRAWPELKGSGGHGLASLKDHLGLKFRHHDGEEDARAAAEVVLRAEMHTGLRFEELCLPNRSRTIHL